MKPAFPAVVMLIPTCWKEVAALNKSPQITPAKSERLFKALSSPGVRGLVLQELFLKNRVTGISVRKPTKLRDRLKV